MRMYVHDGGTFRVIVDDELLPFESSNDYENQVKHDGMVHAVIVEPERTILVSSRGMKLMKEAWG